MTGELFELPEAEDVDPRGWKALERAADPVHGGTGLHGKQAYAVDLIEAWTVRYIVLADSPQEARDIAMNRPVMRVRQRTRRAACEVETCELWGGDGKWPGWADDLPRTRRDITHTDPERDYILPAVPEKGEHA